MPEADPKKLVSERLKMVHRLIEYNETLVEAEGTGVIDPTHAYRAHDALVNYLLLTCFDVLGQGKEFRTFDQWLTSKKTKGDRVAIVLTEEQRADPIKSAMALYAVYQPLYSVRNSFRQFIDELPVEARKALLDSVFISHKDAPHEFLPDEEAKKLFLYQYRNSFTHQAIANGQLSRTLIPHIVTLDKGGEIRWGQDGLAEIKDLAYTVRGWPFVLYKTVAEAIGEKVPDFKIDIQIIADVGEGEEMVWRSFGTSNTNLLEVGTIRMYAKQYGKPFPPR